MSDTKVSAFTAASSYLTTDILHAVIDPGGTPLDRKITFATLFGKIPAAPLPNAAAGFDLGSAALPWKDLYLAGSSGTPGTNNFKITGASTSGTRTVTLADGNSVSVIPDTGAANNFLTAISAGGVISKAQPTFAALASTPTTLSGYGITDAANGALSNLASVSINTSLLAQTGVDLGSTAKPFRNLFLFGAGTYATTYLELTGTPTGTRTITLPDNDTTVPIIPQAITVSGPTAARTWTVDDAAITIARRDAGQTFTGVQIFTSPKILTDISDTNGNELIKFTATASAVNEVTIANAATTAKPTITFTGETNVGGQIFTSGTGELRVGSVTGPTGGAAGRFSVRSGLSNNNALEPIFEAYKASTKGSGVKIEVDDSRCRLGPNWLTGSTSMDLILGGIAGATDRNNLLLGSAGDVTVQNALGNGQNLKIDSVTENTTLSTGGATTDTTIQLPANAIIISVTARITTTIAGVDSTSVDIGDANVSTRFGSMAALTSGTTVIGLNQFKGGVITDNAGPVQVSAASVRITLSGGVDNTPSAGVVRITIHYITFTAATS